MYTPVTLTDIIIGIINDDMMTQNDEIEIDDFTDREWKGYGLYLYSMLKYHASQREHDGTFEYGRQFKYGDNDTITMELDLTQSKNKNGILSFDTSAVYDPRIPRISLARVNENSFYSDININKRYRMAIAIQCCFTASIALVVSDS
eukprot:UN07629